MKYLFGPVNSRRLGLSQGIDILPAKICNYNCIYCEVGATTELTCERREYVPVEAILAEIDGLLAQPERLAALDFFTVTASGEPTLHAGIGRIIRYLKERAAKPVAVLTNGSLFHLPEVRHDLAAADVVVPSLDAVNPDSFRRINRPAGCCATPEQMVEGLHLFGREFAGQVWLEILLVKGVNDRPEDLAALRRAIARINPARVQLNTVARPPLERFAHPLSGEELTGIAALLREDYDGMVELLVEVVDPGGAESRPHREAQHLENDIEQMLRRRPCTAADIASALRQSRERVQAALTKLTDERRIGQTEHDGKEYFQALG